MATIVRVTEFFLLSQTEAGNHTPVLSLSLNEEQERGGAGAAIPLPAARTCAD